MVYVLKTLRTVHVYTRTVQYVTNNFAEDSVVLDTFRKVCCWRARHTMSSLSWMSSSGLSTSVHGLQRARSSAPSRNKTVRALFSLHFKRIWLNLNALQSSVHEQNPCSCCLHSLSLVRRMGTMIRKQNVSVKEIVHAYVEKVSN